MRFYPTGYQGGTFKVLPRTAPRGCVLLIYVMSSCEPSPACANIPDTLTKSMTRRKQVPKQPAEHTGGATLIHAAISHDRKPCRHGRVAADCGRGVASHLEVAVCHQAKTRALFTSPVRLLPYRCLLWGLKDIGVQQALEHRKA